MSERLSWGGPDTKAGREEQEVGLVEWVGTPSEHILAGRDLKATF